MLVKKPESKPYNARIMIVDNESMGPIPIYNPPITTGTARKSNRVTSVCSYAKEIHNHIDTTPQTTAARFEIGVPFLFKDQIRQTNIMTMIKERLKNICLVISNQLTIHLELFHFLPL
ncbi:hypothetical protein GCM10007199_10510 [Fictibacillus barbaricus]|nr:hypothetical protein GCM10007199_10510 [Fictibacillus barbaricus]